MPVYEFAPHPLLAGNLHSFSCTERCFAAPNDSFDILPDSLVELVYCFGAPCHVASGGQSIALPTCFVVGLLDTPIRITAHGNVRTVRARLYPWGVAPLIGALLDPTPVPGVRGLLWPDASLSHIAGLETALAESNTRAVDLVQAVLLEQALTHTLHNPTVIVAAQRMLTLQGNITVDELAHSVGLSPRTLRRQFQALFGTGPKLLAQTARFERMRDMLWDDPDTSLADAALQAGYTDQAHMQREFVRFSQRTPRQFATEMRHMRVLLGVQDGRNIQDQ